MGTLTRFSFTPLTIFLLALSFSSGAKAANGQEMTLNQYCPQLTAGMRDYDEDSEGYRSLQAQHRELCVGKPGGEEYYRKTLAEVGASQNQWLDQARRTASATEVEEAAQDAIRQAGQDKEALFHQCKTICGQSEAACRASLANARSVEASEYNRLRSLTGGNEASVNQACNSIPSYRSTIDGELQKAERECNQYRQQCQNTCQEAERKAASIGGGASDWMSANQNAGQASANTIPTHVQSVRDMFSNQSQAVQTMCDNARADLAKDKQAKNDEQKKAKEDAKKQQNTQNALGNALQSLGQALAQPPAEIPPYYGTDTSTPALVPPQVTTDAYGGMPTAVKNTNGFGPTNPGAGGDPLLLGDGLEGPAPHQASKLSRMPQQPGGATGSVGSGGGGGSAPSRSARRYGSRSRFDTDVLKGGGAGASAAGARSGGNGYPDDESGGTGGGRLNRGKFAGGANPQTVSLRKFLPTGVPTRRGVANVVGPDGITGPHTDLFKKIRTRYNDTLLDNNF